MQDIGSLLETGRSAAAGSESLAALDEVRVRFLGKKGELTQLLKQLGSLPPEERPAAGQAINKAKQALQETLDARRTELETAALEANLAAETADLSLIHISEPTRRTIPSRMPSSA